MCGYLSLFFTHEKLRIIVGGEERNLEKRGRRELESRKENGSKATENIRIYSLKKQRPREEEDDDENDDYDDQRGRSVGVIVGLRRMKAHKKNPESIPSALSQRRII